MRFDLLAGDYQSRSVIGSAQRRLNMYSESLPPTQGEPGKVVHYPTPGLHLLTTSPNGKPVRGLYRASNGDLYTCAGFDVYFVDSTFTWKLIGTMQTTNVLNPVKFADNGVSVILCDGTAVNGYSINMKQRLTLDKLFNPTAGDALTTSSDGWMGSTFVDFSDGYFIANSIDTPIFYISNAEDLIFDSTQFAAKNAYADKLVGAIVQHRVIWLIGELTTEVWFDSGGGTLGSGQNMPFELMPGVLIDYGCRAPYSIAKAETSIFWLAQNLNGEVLVLRGSGYNVKRVSTHAIEHIIGTYKNPGDCNAYCFLVNGHTFYVMNFQEDDATWVYDLSMEVWHQLAFIDHDGTEHAHRSTMHAFAYDFNIVNDRENGNLYALDLDTYTDNGQPIKRVIGFPRMPDRDSDRRVGFRSFIAEIDSGETKLPVDNVTMMLTWSDDKGKTWSNSVPQSLGTRGQFAKFAKWQRLGISRNRVFQLEWTTEGLVALTGAYVEVNQAAT